MNQQIFSACGVRPGAIALLHLAINRIWFYRTIEIVPKLIWISKHRNTLTHTRTRYTCVQNRNVLNPMMMIDRVREGKMWGLQGWKERWSSFMILYREPIRGSVCVPKDMELGMNREIFENSIWQNGSMTAVKWFRWSHSLWGGYE